MRSNVHGPYQPDEATRERPVLLSVVRPFGQPNTEANSATSRMFHVRAHVRQARGRDSQDQGRQTLLLTELLVSVQPKRQPLPLGWWARRSYVARWSSVAAFGDAARRWALSDLRISGTGRGASHPVVHWLSGVALGCWQWHNTVPSLPPADSPAARSAARRCGTLAVHGISATCGVAC